ncbi:hypothetical protein MMMB2_4506 [Mycobacterium marinum MB2]|nr:hypothetical protein MMMB2_4506 [Mycobacterium marinum MB2]
MFRDRIMPTASTNWLVGGRVRLAVKPSTAYLTGARIARLGAIVGYQ